MHLLVDISSHGFGHLSMTAPVINALTRRLPGLRLTVRSGLPTAKLAERIAAPFAHLAGPADFGFVMHDALRIDHPATAAAYRARHADWPAAVEAEARFLKALQPSAVFSNIAALPLAGAARLGIPAYAFCCLNWADLLLAVFAGEAWVRPVADELLAAYGAAVRFFCPAPSMPMPSLANVHPVAPVACSGKRHDLGLTARRSALIGMGGIAHRLPLAAWPAQPGWQWIVPANWQQGETLARSIESFGLSFTDLLASVDVVVGKPGYGTFVEAACNATPLLYQRRDDWPEQEMLIAWLEQHGTAAEIDAASLTAGCLQPALDALLARPRKPAVVADGHLPIVDALAGALLGAPA